MGARSSKRTASREQSNASSTASKSSSKSAQSKTKVGPNIQRAAPILRIIAVNDVYKLDRLPALRTLILDENEAAERTGGKLFTCLAGDFLSPSILSSLDKGKAMVDVFNQLPVDFVSLGNHEADVPESALKQRIEESRFKWINTNMPDFAMNSHPNVVPHVIVEVGGKKIAFIGLCTSRASLFRKGNGFGNALPQDVIKTAREYAEKLRTESKVDLVIPLTHQDVPEDVALCKAGLGFPLVLGGHDHEIHEGTYDGGVLVKAGADAEHAYVIDVTFVDNKPVVVTRLVKIDSVKPDAHLKHVVEHHMKVVRELDEAVLYDTPEGETLTCVRVRFQPSNMAALIATAIRNSSHADCTLLNSGCVRSESEYSKDLTFGDLKRVLPFQTAVVVISLPGSVLASAIKYSREAHAGEEYGGYLQVDDLLVLSPTNDVLSVNGQPFNPSKMYEVAVPHCVANGVDEVKPLVEYSRAHPDAIPAEEAGMELKEYVVAFFARKLWDSIFAKVGSEFHELDLDGDGQITAAEVNLALRKSMKGMDNEHSTRAALRALDKDGDGTIDREEFEAAKKAAAAAATLTPAN